MRAFAGVDIGTQGTKAALFDESGTVLASAFRRSALHQPAPGTVEEDPERQVATVCQTLRACVEQAPAAGAGVVGLGITGQMAGVLGVGADGQSLTHYDSWLDTRCSPYIQLMEETAGERILSRTGGPVSFNHGPKILWWRQERPKIFRHIRAFVQPGGYAAMRLCGLSAADAFIDKTYLHFSGFADNPAGRWDTGLCRTFRLDAALLPRIVNSSDIVGELQEPQARRCGLRAGVPVVAGCGDSAAAFLACGATQPGICVDVAGTASVFASVAASFRPDSALKILSCGQAATPGLWHPYAYINGGGLNLEWFREVLNGNSRPAVARIRLEELDRRAAKLRPTEDLPMFVPHLSGRVSPAWPGLRGAWINLDRTHRAPHLWRAMLEGVALEYAIYKQALQALHPRWHPTELRVTGGGVRSAFWNQIKADVLETKVVQVARTAGATAGAALLAANGVGMIRDLDAGARQWLSTGKVTRPNRRTAPYHTARLSRYKSLLAAMHALS